MTDTTTLLGALKIARDTLAEVPLRDSKLRGDIPAALLVIDAAIASNATEPTAQSVAQDTAWAVKFDNGQKNGWLNEGGKPDGFPVLMSQDNAQNLCISTDYSPRKLHIVAYDITAGRASLAQPTGDAPTANTLAGFKGGFAGVNRRAPTEQEIWDAGVHSGMHRQPTGDAAGELMQWDEAVIQHAKQMREAGETRLHYVSVPISWILDVPKGQPGYVQVPVEPTDADLLPYLRQYMHNDGSGLTFGYDRQGADRVFALLRSKAQENRADASRYRHLVATFNIDYAPEEPWQLVVWDLNPGEYLKAKLDEAIDRSIIAAASKDGATAAIEGKEIPHTDHPMRHYDRTCQACNATAAMDGDDPVGVVATQKGGSFITSFVRHGTDAFVCGEVMSDHKTVMLWRDLPIGTKLYALSQENAESE